MARGVNKVILIGNLGKDPEMKSFPNGDAFCNLTLATSESWTDKTSGEKKEETEWFNIVAWRNLAERCEKYLHKGSKVYIEGRITQRKYTDRDGIQRTAVDVIANDVQFLTPKSATVGAGSYAGNSSDSDDPFLPDFPDDAS